MSKIDLVVLGFLKRKPMHGYEIAGNFSKRGIDVWVRVKTPSVYKALTRLEERDCIVGYVEQIDNNPPRKVFSITKTGEKYFSQLLKETLKSSEKNSIFDFWNAMRFVKGNLTKDQFIDLIEEREIFLDIYKQKMMKRCEDSSSQEKLSEFPFYVKIMMDSMKKIGKIELETLEKLKEEATKNSNQKDFLKG